MARLPLWCNLRHPGGCPALWCLSVSLKSYYGCWEYLQWRKTWVSPSLPTHPVPGSSRRVFLAWLHARGSLYTKQSGKVHRATETDGSGLAWSNGSHRAFGISLMQVFACQPFCAIHCSSVWGMAPKLPKYKPSCKFFSYTHSPVSLLMRYHFIWEPELKIEARLSPLQLLCTSLGSWRVSCGSIRYGVSNEVGFMAVHVYLTIDFHAVIKLIACCWQYSLIFIIRHVQILV